MSAHFYNNPPSTSYIPPPTYPFSDAASFAHHGHQYTQGGQFNTASPGLAVSNGAVVRTRTQPQPQPAAASQSTPPPPRTTGQKDALSQAALEARLAATAADGSGNAKTWNYPHTRGSNVVDFRAEIEERTKNGESCDQIAAALIAKGVHTSSKTISRQRILMGLRKRAVRKENPNRKAPYERKHGPRKVQPKVVAQKERQSQITQMTEQGLSAEEIASIMISRGMPLVKGASTIRRLQSSWKLRMDPHRVKRNARHMARKRARLEQRAEFERYAAELGLQDSAGWVAQKMSEPAVQQLRKDRSHVLMGEHAPKSGDRKNAAVARPGNPRGSGNKQHPNKSTTDAGLATAHQDSDFDGDSSDESSDDGSHAQIQRPTRSRPSGGARPSENYNTVKHPGDPSDDSESVDSEYEPHQNLPTATPRFEPMPAISPVGGGDYQDDSDYGPMMQDNDYDDDDDAEQMGDINSPQDNTQAPPPTQQQPPAPSVAFPAPVLPVEEANANKETIGSINSQIAAAQSLKDLLEARMNGTPMRGNLTGLPPSLADIAAARKEAKTATEAILAML
ncbi:Uu.00g132930.m01.CDS01 [Anthostomella pinea]|uniref:Uu.00g132930.m01.CDS01 n=1 Tax=Anthostomella pinea TaxID=933095 RepID=A0AAI8VTQ4_9PEZI|nr:Uu.00g132930.m01.CDS01 [Anthostomella pinea]